LCGFTRAEHWRRLAPWIPAWLREHCLFWPFFQRELQPGSTDTGLAMAALRRSRAREASLDREVQNLRNTNARLQRDLDRANVLIARLTNTLEQARG
jgi:hypothetical protein